MSKPFAGLKVYYSGSIKGAVEPDPDFPQKLVEYIADGGADVLSEHVAIQDQNLRDKTFAKNSGIDLRKVSLEEKRVIIRRQDLAWIRESNKVVVLANAPSHGVGMEIQEAIVKEKPVLCLVREDLFHQLSFMISGVTPQEAPKFYLRTYQDLSQAQQHISDFLSGRI